MNEGHLHALQRVFDRPGQSCLLYYPLGTSPPRLLFRTSGPVSLRLHLSHRVLTYMRHALWACQLPELPAVFSREPITVSALQRSDRAQPGPGLPTKVGPLHQPTPSSPHSPPPAPPPHCPACRASEPSC